MHIGLIAPPWIPVPPSAYGGTESVIANLACGLRARGHEVDLFTVGESTCPVRRRHLFPHAVEPMGQGTVEAAHVLAAYEELRGVDVIHDHTMLGPLIAGSRRLRTPPVVTTNHGPFTAITRRVYREIARSAAVVAISNDQATRAGDVPIAAVIHHGVDLEAYRPGPGTGGYLAFVGRMSPEKGVHHAVAIAKEAGVPLRIVSKMREPAEKRYFDTCVRPLLSRGEPQPEELELGARIEVLRDALGLLNPIRWAEPFGLVMAEALASGTPVISSPCGAAPEIVTPGLTGFMCAEDGDAAVAVGRLGALSRLDCREEAESRFSVGRMAADYEWLYRRVLDSRVSRRLFGQAGVPRELQLQ